MDYPRALSQPRVYDVSSTHAYCPQMKYRMPSDYYYPATNFPAIQSGLYFSADANIIIGFTWYDCEGRIAYFRLAAEIPEQLLGKESRLLPTLLLVK